MELADPAIASDQDRGRHVLDLERSGDVAARVVDDLQSAVHGREEGLGPLALAIEVHGDDRQVPQVDLLELFHEREGQLAGAAPGGPEVEIDDLAAIGADVEPRRLGSLRDQRPARRGRTKGQAGQNKTTSIRRAWTARLRSNWRDNQSLASSRRCTSPRHRRPPRPSSIGYEIADCPAQSGSWGPGGDAARIGRNG